MRIKDQELGFQLLMSTLNVYNEKIRKLEQQQTKIVTACRMLNEIVDHQRIRINQLEAKQFARDHEYISRKYYHHHK